MHVFLEFSRVEANTFKGDWRAVGRNAVEVIEVNRLRLVFKLRRHPYAISGVHIMVVVLFLAGVSLTFSEYSALKVNFLHIFTIKNNLNSNVPVAWPKYTLLNQKTQKYTMNLDLI